MVFINVFKVFSRCFELKMSFHVKTNMNFDFSIITVAEIQGK